MLLCFCALTSYAQNLRFGELYSMIERSFNDCEKMIISKNFYLDTKESWNPSLYSRPKGRQSPYKIGNSPATTYFYRSDKGQVLALSVLSKDNKVYCVKYYINSTNLLEYYVEQIENLEYHITSDGSGGDSETLRNVRLIPDRIENDLANFIDVRYKSYQTVIAIHGGRNYGYPEDDGKKYYNFGR